MTRSFLLASFIILTIGVLFRLALTQNGNFLFNMDSARDFVDVREIVELNKLRLTGPNTAIEGLFSGPFWYYLLAGGYILTDGDPYSAVLIQIILWVVGGFFLFKIVSKWSNWLILPIGSLWVASNYIVLANLYSFNPTPVMLLSPLFIFMLINYLDRGKAIYIVLTWILAGIFFNLEMNFGVFIPAIIFFSVILINKYYLFKQKWFWLGFLIFFLTLLPQIIFDVKHQSIMSQAVMRHLSQNFGNSLDITTRFQIISASFYNTFLPTMMNKQILVLGILLLSVSLLKKISVLRKETNVIVPMLYIFVPFVGYLVVPVSVNPWHLGGPMVASLVIVGYVIFTLWQRGFLGKSLSLTVSVILVMSAASNILNYIFIDSKKQNNDPSLFKNEIAAIDYVYRYADGKNFKVYTYLPSIIDYPYQYLIWWYGLKHFGYLPIDYAYAPDKPVYISNKKHFSETEDSLKKRQNSNLIFLIKEPNRNYTRFGWEGEFAKFKTVKKQKLGLIEIEIKQGF